MGKGSTSMHRSGFRFAAVAALIIAVLVPSLVPSRGSAEAALDSPKGDPILTVSGSVATPNAGQHALFDRRMLAALPQHEIRTSTEWTDGVKVFRGPLVSDVLAAAGASGSIAVATALNDYAVEIPVGDFSAYPVILALSMDGEVLTVRNKGPLWIVYPRDDYAELRNSEMNSRWIWQLRSLEVR